MTTLSPAEIKLKILPLLGELLDSHKACVDALRAAEQYGHTHPDAWAEGEKKRESFSNTKEAVINDLIKLCATGGDVRQVPSKIECALNQAQRRILRNVVNGNCVVGQTSTALQRLGDLGLAYWNRGSKRIIKNCTQPGKWMPTDYGSRIYDHIVATAGVID